MSDPFGAPPAGPEPAAAGPTIPCATCATPIDPSTASWSEQGERICKRCEAVQTIETGDQRAAATIVGGGIGALMLGLSSMCFNPLFLMSVLAIGSGVGTLVTIVRHPEYKEKMGWQYPVALGGAVMGILLGLVYPFIFLLAMVGAVSAAVLR